MRRPTRDLSDRHEAFLGELLEAPLNPGSGNQFNNPTDARQSRFHRAMAFAVDGKATLAKSMSITRAMIDKLREQARGERPMLGVRFYDGDALTSYDDWVMIEAEDFRALMQRSDKLQAIEEMVGGGDPWPVSYELVGSGLVQEWLREVLR